MLNLIIGDAIRFAVGVRLRNVANSGTPARSGLLASDELQGYVVGLCEPQRAIEASGGRVVAGGYKLYQGRAVLAGYLSHALDQEPSDSPAPVSLVYHQGGNLDYGIAVSEVWFDPERSHPSDQPLGLGHEGLRSGVLQKFPETVTHRLPGRGRVSQRGGELARQLVRRARVVHASLAQAEAVFVMRRVHYRTCNLP